jgi:hypothetical protein
MITLDARGTIFPIRLFASNIPCANENFLRVANVHVLLKRI